MAQRDEVISVVDYHNGLSWRYAPDEIERYFDRHGIFLGKLMMLWTLWKGLRSAQSTYLTLKKAAQP